MVSSRVQRVSLPASVTPPPSAASAAVHSDGLISMLQLATPEPLVQSAVRIVEHAKPGPSPARESLLARMRLVSEGPLSTPPIKSSSPLPSATSLTPDSSRARTNSASEDATKAEPAAVPPRPRVSEQLIGFMRAKVTPPAKGSVPRRVSLSNPMSTNASQVQFAIILCVMLC